MIDGRDRDRWSWAWDILESLGEVAGELLFALIRGTIELAIQALGSMFDGL